MGADFRIRIITTLRNRLESAKRDAVKWICQRSKTGAYRLRIKVKSEFDDFIMKKGREQSWEIR